MVDGLNRRLSSSGNQHRVIMLLAQGGHMILAVNGRLAAWLARRPICMVGKENDER